MDKRNGKVKYLLNLGILNILTLNILYAGSGKKNVKNKKRCCCSGKGKENNNVNTEGSNEETEEQRKQREKEEKDRKEKEEREKASLDERINNAIEKLNKLKIEANNINSINDHEFTVTVYITEEDIKKANKNTIADFENRLDKLEEDINEKKQKLHEKQELKKFQDDNKDKVKALSGKITEFNSCKFYDLEIKDFVVPAELDVLEYKNIGNFNGKLEKNEKELQDKETTVKTKLKEDREKIIKKIKEEKKKEEEGKNGLVLVKEEDVIGEDVISNCDCNNGFDKLSEHYCLIQKQIELISLKTDQVKNHLTKDLKKYENILIFFNIKNLDNINAKISELINKLPDKITSAHYTNINSIISETVNLQTKINNEITLKNKHYSGILGEVKNNYKDLESKIENFYEIDCFKEIDGFINTNKGIKDKIELVFTFEELNKINNFYEELKKKYDKNVVKFKTDIINNIKILKDIYTNIPDVDKKYKNFFTYKDFQELIEKLSKDEFINKNDTDETKFQNYTILLNSIITKIKENIKNFVEEVQEKSKSKNAIINEDISKIASEFSITLPDLDLNIITDVQKFDYFYYPFYMEGSEKNKNTKEDIQKYIKSGDNFFKDIDKKVEKYKKDVFNIFVEIFNNINSLFNFEINKIVKRTAEKDNREYYNYIHSREINFDTKYLEKEDFDAGKKIIFRDNEYLLYYYKELNKDSLIKKFGIDYLVVLANNIKLIFDHNFNIFQDILEIFKKHYNIEKRSRLEEVFVDPSKTEDKVLFDIKLRPTYEFLNIVKDFKGYIQYLNSNKDKVDLKEIKIKELFKINIKIAGININLKNSGFYGDSETQNFLNLINIDIFNSIGSFYEKLIKNPDKFLNNDKFEEVIGSDYGNDDEKILNSIIKNDPKENILKLQKAYFKNNPRSLFYTYGISTYLEDTKKNLEKNISLYKLLTLYLKLKKISDEIPDKITK